MELQLMNKENYSMNSDFKPNQNSLLNLGRKRLNATATAPIDFMLDKPTIEEDVKLSRVINPYDKSNSILGGRSRRHKRKTTRRHKRKMRSTRRRKSHSSRRSRK
jgi:hypothetical protein